MSKNMEAALKLETGRSWNNFEANTEKSLPCHEWNNKGDSDEHLEEKEGCRV
jgi:hypothetical protein